MPESPTPLDRYRPLVDDWPAFIDALSRPLPVCVWTNTLRTDRETVYDWLHREGLSPRTLSWNSSAFRLGSDSRPGNRLPYQAGLYHVQEEAAMLPAVLLEPRPEERILDLCAAPGNKTAQIAVSMHNRGSLIANDRSEGRLHILRTTLARLGIVNTSTTVFDAVKYPGNELFDCILLDGPCSCEGTSRKHPAVLRTSTPQRACHMGNRLALMLRRAVQLCRPGGRIAYSTCTYAPEENEAVIDEMLNRYGDRLSVVQTSLEGFTASPGITEWQGSRYDSQVRNTLRIWPHQNDTGGFYVALLQKSTNPEHWDRS